MLAALCLVVTAAPQLMPPVRVDNTLAMGPLSRQTQAHVAAFDGGWMLAWTDMRSSGIWPDVYAAAVFTDGGLSSPGGVRLGTGEGYDADPAVACGASVCAVILNHRYTTTLVVRLGFDGTPLDPAPAALPFAIGEPAITWTGADFVFAGIGSGGLYTGHLSADGRPSLAPVLSVPATVPLYRPQLASDGVNLELAWRSYDTGGLTGAHVALISPAGALLDGPQTLAAGAGAVALASAPDGGFLAVISAGGLFATRIKANGALVDVPAFVANNRTSAVVGGVAWTSNGWVLTDTDYDSVDVIGLDRALGSLGRNQVHRPATECAQAAESAGQLLLVSCDRGAQGAVHLSAIRSGTSPLLTPLGSSRPALLWGPAAQLSPAVALDDLGGAVAWLEETDAGFDVRARHFTPDGLPDGPAVDIASGAGAQTAVTLEWDGAAFEVAWADGPPGQQMLKARRFDRRFSPLGAEQVISPASIMGVPSMARVPGGVMLLWWRYENPSRIHLTRIIDGGVVGGAAPLLPSGSGQTQSALAANDAGALVVWVDNSGGALGAARTDLAGNVIDAGLLVQTYAWYPAVATDGRSWLVAWHDHGGPSHRVFATRVSPEGVRLDAVPLDIPVARTRTDAFGNAGSSGSPLSVVFDGDDYRVLWNEQSPDAGVQVRQARVFSDGGVGLAEDVSSSADDEEQPVSTAGESAMLVAWRRFDSSIGAGRIELRMTQRPSRMNVPVVPPESVYEPARGQRPLPIESETAQAERRRELTVGCETGASAPLIALALAVVRRRRGKSRERS